MSEAILLDQIVITLTVRRDRPEIAKAAARGALLRGGFVPRLRKVVRSLTSEYPALRGVGVTVSR